MVDDTTDDGFAWQVGVWDKMADIYQREIDSRFGPVIEHVLARADLQPSEAVLKTKQNPPSANACGGIEADWTFATPSKDEGRSDARNAAYP